MRAHLPDSGSRHRLSTRSRTAIVLIETIALMAALLGPAIAQDQLPAGTTGTSEAVPVLEHAQQADPSPSPSPEPTPRPTPEPAPDPTPKPEPKPDPTPKLQDQQAPVPTPKAVDPTTAPVDPTPKPADPTLPPAEPTPDVTPAPDRTPDARPTPDPTPDPTPAPTPDQPTSTPDQPGPTPDPTDPAQPTPTPDQPTPAPTPTPDPGTSPAPSAVPSPSAAPSPSVAPSPSASPAPAETKPLIVRFAAGTSAADQDAIIAAAGGTQTDSIPALRIRVIVVAPALAADIKAAYLADPRVVSVENDRVRASDAIPDDPAWDSQWNLRKIDWAKARDLASPQQRVTIAVLDTGIDASHPDLAGHVTGGWSAFEGGDPFADPDGHGTAVAGIAAATTDNATAVAGVAWAATDLLSVQVLGATGQGTDSDIINGLVWAADHGADVILMAFSNPGYSSALQAAVDYAWARGSVLVAAAGNDGSSVATYPAGDHHVVGVSATDTNDDLAPGSNHGDAAFLSAPGIAIPATSVGGGWTTIAGTSAAAAEVAGAAAIVKAIAGASNGVVIGRLAYTAAPDGGASGNGRIDLLRAVSDTSTGFIDPAGVAGGGGPIVGPYIAAATKYWVGCADTSWTTNGNWSTSSSATCSGSAPNTGATTAAGSADTATILTGKARYPSITTGAVTVAGITVNSGGAVTVAGGTLSLTGAMTVSSGGTLTVSSGSLLTSSSLTVNGRLDVSGGTVHMNASAATAPIANITLNNATAVVNLSAGAIETYSYTTIAGATLNQTGGTFRLYRDFVNAGSYLATAGDFVVAGNGGSSSQFNALGTNQFFNVVVNSGITARFASVANTQFQVKGDWTVNGTVSATRRVNTITFNGTGDQTIGGTASTTFRNLVINKTAGAVILGRTTNLATTTYAGTLTLTNGRIVTGGNAMVINTLGSVARTNGFVEGNLLKQIATGTNVARTFEVGTGSIYSPVTVTYASVTTAGTLTVSAAAGQHPQIASAKIVAAADVARYWTLSSVTAVFTTATVAFTYDATDVTGGTPTSFQIQRYSGTWQTPSVSSATATSATGTGYSAFGSFAVGAVATAATSGDGTLTVAPTTAVAGSAGNSLLFTFAAPITKDFASSSATTIGVPADWTAPQSTDSTAAGYVQATSGTCIAGSPTISGSGPWTISVPHACAHGTSFTVTYGGGTSVSKVTAPQAAGSRTFTAQSRAGSGGTLTTLSASPSVTIGPSTASKLQVLLPGETADPGSVTGRTGTPTAITAGDAVSVTVNAVDAYWNVVTSGTAYVELSSSDAHAGLPVSGVALANGTATLSVQLRTAGSRTVTATDTDASPLTAGTSGAVSVSGGSATQLQVLLSGETADPGSSTGKTGAPTDKVSGDSTTVTVNAVDAWFNLDASATPTISLASTDAQVTAPADTALVGGTTSFSIQLRTATAGTGTTFTASRVSGGAALTAGTSDEVQVAAGAATHLHVSAPATATSGLAFQVTLSARDAWQNVATGYAGTVHFTTTDGGAGIVLPGDTTLTDGSDVFLVKLVTAGSQSVTATDTVASGITGSSDTITVGAAAATNLNLGLSPTTITANGTATSTATVRITDASGNLITGTSTPTIVATTGDVSVDSVTGSNGLYTATITASKTAGTNTITASYTSLSDARVLTEVAGPAAKLLVLMPGETAAPGTLTGKTGTATTRTAGVAFSVTVRAVDANFNLVSTATHTVALTSNDTNAASLGSGSLVGGSRTYTVTLRTATGGSATTVVTASATSGSPTLTNGAGTAVAVDAGVATQLLVSLPGQTWVPGSVTGHTGTPTDQTAGSAVTITVRAVDAWNNLVASQTPTVSFITSDANITAPGAIVLSGGTGTAQITFRSGGSRTVTGSASGLLADTSDPVRVVSGTGTQLRILLPGETADPGSLTGKTGTPSQQTSGSAFNVTVQVVDAYWNVATGSSVTAVLTSTDTNATMPVAAGVTSGSSTVSVTLKTGGARTLTATQTAGTPTVSAGTSASVTVVAGAATKLLVLLPGEAAAPGTLTGRSGTPTSIYAGDTLTVTVQAVDANWNLVESSTATAHLVSTDSAAVVPADEALVGGVQLFDVTFKTSGVRTVTASDANPGTLISNTSGSLTVIPGNAVDFRVTAPSTATAGVPFQVTVTAIDAYGNTDTEYPGTVTFTSTDGSATLPADSFLTTSAGVGVFSVTLRNAGARTITATDVDDATINGTSGTITVNAAAATNLGLTLSPVSLTADGTATSVATALVTDASGNAIKTQKSLTISIQSGDVTISGVSFNATTGAYTATITASKTAGSNTIRAIDATDGNLTADATLAENAGAATKLQVLLPGETAAPGTATGKTGTASAVTAGAIVGVTVNAVDANWNVVTTVTHTVRLTATDANATLPADAALVNGTRTLSVTLRTAAVTTTITATDRDAVPLTTGSGSLAVNAGTATKLQVLLPGETAAPGTANGKTGTPTDTTAGSPVSVTVNAVDDWWNVASAATPTVTVTTTDGNAVRPSPNSVTLAAGTATFWVTLRTADYHTITTTQTAGSPTVTAGTSAIVHANAGSADHLLVTLPGETYAAGTAAGKTGTATALTAGATVLVTVRAVDAWSNAITTATPTVAVSASDTAAVLPANAALVGGIRTFSITLRTAGATTIGAAWVSGTPTFAAATTTSTLTVNAGSVVKLQILLPGETAAPGTTTGKTGTPNDTTVGTQVDVTVNAVDANWNVVAGATPTVRVTTTDPNDTEPSTTALVAGTITLHLTFVTAGFWSATTTDASGSPTLAANTTGTIHAEAGAVTDLLVLLPGETYAPGTLTGKTGTPTAITAGSTVSVTVRAVDAHQNVNTTSAATVRLTSNDSHATLPADTELINGARTVVVTLVKATTTATTTAADTTVGSTVDGTSANLAVNAGSAIALQVLLPGETADPGSLSGKTGAPTDRTAGDTITVTVNAVDTYWNVVASATPTVAITTTDPADTEPAEAALVSGTRGFSVTLITAGRQTVTATRTSGTPSVSAGTSASVHVNAGAAASFDVVPSVTMVKAGVALSITVTARDSLGNVADAYAGTIHVTSTDLAAVLPANTTLLAGVRTLPVTLNTPLLGQTITATDTLSSGITGTSVGITVGLATGAHVSVVLSPPTITADPDCTNPVVCTTTITATITDSLGLPAVGHTVVMTTSGDASIGTVTGHLDGTYTATLTASRSADLETITVTDQTQSISSTATLTELPQPASKLLVLLPGESVNPGSLATGSGKTGSLSPSSVTAGDWVTVRVLAVDEYWNVLTNATPTVLLTSPDSHAALPGADTLADGQGTFLVSLRTARALGWTITATDQASSGPLTANTSTALPVVPGAAVKLQALLPGQTADPGSPTGFTGSPTATTAGQTITGRINATDAWWNVVTTATPDVRITATDPNAATSAWDITLVAGTATPSGEFRTAGFWSITATDISATPTLAPITSMTVDVRHGPAVKLQVLLPGETADPGSVTGKTGSPTARTAGTEFVIVVSAVDQYWNMVDTAQPVIHFASSDPHAEFIADHPLLAGTHQFPATLNRASAGSTITVSDPASSGALTANTSSSVVVNAGTPDRIQVLVPGEVADPGSDTGKTAAVPTAVTAGATETVTINAVDPRWNVVASVTSTVRMTTTGAHATFPDGTDVTFTAGTTTARVTLPREEDPTVTGTWLSGGTELTAGTSAQIPVDHGTVAKLQVLLPGETADPGSATGKTGTPSHATAGTPVGVRVNAVDAYWNVVETGTPVTIVLTTDTHAVLPAPDALSGGTETFAVTFRTATASGWDVTAHDVDDVDIHGSSAPVPVDAGTATRLQILTPGEVADPGSDTGKIAATAEILVGAPFQVVVNVTDQWWNPVTSASPTIHFGSLATGGGPSAHPHTVLPDDSELSDGTGTFPILSFAWGYPTFTVSDASASPTLLADASSIVDIDPLTPTKLQVLLPGQTADPGSITGFTGTPQAQVPGDPVLVRVSLVDQYWNPVEPDEAVDELIGLTSSDAAAVLPPTEATQGGTAVMVVTFETPGSQTVTATALARDLDSGTSSATTVSGTTIVAPPTLAIGTGFPGQVVTSPVAYLSWNTTEPGKRVTVRLTAAFQDGQGHAIAMTDATLLRIVDGEPVVVGTLDGTLDLVTITDGTGSQAFRIRVTIPAAPANSYFTVLSYQLVSGG